MTTLPRPNYVDRDYQTILNEWIAAYEAATGEVLQPASRERLLVDIGASRELLARQRLQEAAEQNLVAYANYPMIDHLGVLLDEPRLAAVASSTTLAFTLETALEFDLVIPEGEKVRSKDRKVTFVTIADTTIPAGSLGAHVGAVCTRPGIVGNGYAPGQIVDLVASPAYPMTVTNVTQTERGRAGESSDEYRERIPLAQRGRSVAGPRQAYGRLARGARSDVVGVSVSNPDGGVVRLAVLSRDGVADAAVLDAVYDACSAETVRPLTDTVEVVSASPVEYSIAIEAKLRRAAFASPTEELFAAWSATLTSRAQAYADSLRSRLGADVVIAQIHHAIMSDEVYDLTLAQPVAMVSVAGDEFASATSVEVVVTGFDEVGP